MTAPADDEPLPSPGHDLLALALESLLSAQLGDERGCRRALRELAGLARRWSGVADLSKFAPALRRSADVDDVDVVDDEGEGDEGDEASDLAGGADAPPAPVTGRHR